MAFDRRNRPRAPTLVGNRKLRRAADGESGNNLERKRRGVIVVDDDHDIRPDLLNPFFRAFESAEYRAPIGFVCLAVVPGSANGRNMRAGNAGDDPGHYALSFHSDLLRFPAGERPPASISFAYSCW